MTVKNLTQQRSADQGVTQPQRSPSVRDSLRALQTEIRFVKGIGPKRAAQLESCGILTIEDLLYHLPFRYEDRRRVSKLTDAVPGQEQSFMGELMALKSKFNPGCAGTS